MVSAIKGGGSQTGAGFMPNRGLIRYKYFIRIGFHTISSQSERRISL